MSLFHRTPSVLRFLVLQLACAVLALLDPHGATAADYSVRLTSTNGTHWHSYGETPFTIGTNKISSGKGIFAAGDYRSWRANVVGTGARIVGGRVRIGVTTPQAVMRGRIVVGTGSTTSVLAESYGTGAVEVAIPAGPFDWVQFDLSSTGAVTTTTSGENHVDLQWIDLALRDTVPPVVEGRSLPDPGQWHGAGACIPFTLYLSDQGGGLARAQVRRASDGVVVTSWDAPMVESPKPGPSVQELADCIAPGERGHGDTRFVATAWDVSGVARELAFTVRADQRAPTISGGLDDGARVTIARPSVAFDLADDGSGVASVSATLDGAPVAVSVNGSMASLSIGELARGSHVIAVAASDAAGNGTRVERRFLVADDAPPQLSLSSPGARGDATAKLVVRASDDMSGVDPGSWSVTVDGVAVAFEADAQTLTAALGPLADGAHRIDVAVRDLAGNRSTAAHAYYVVPPNAPSVAEVAAQVAATSRSGVFVVDAPRAAVAFGRSATVSVQVVRNGDPVAGQHVTVRRDGADVAAGATDADGIARVSIVANRPGRYEAIADGMGFDSVALPIKVAPRVAITTSTTRPKVGARVRIVGKVFPALRGRTVSVEARVGGVWFPVRRVARTDVAGRFATTVVSAAPGPIHIRVKLKPAGAWSGANSNVRLLRVTR